MADDFFEDDLVEEKKPAPEKKPSQKGKDNRKKTVVAKGVSKQSEGFTFDLGQKIDLTWVIAIAIAAFTIGFVVHAAFFKSTTDTTGSSYSTTSGTSSAPPLSEEQLKQYQGNLPAGHPDINSASGASTQTGTGASGTQGGSNGTTGK